MYIRLEDNLKDINAAAWDALLERNPVNTVFQTSAWHAAWWDSYATGKTLFIVCAEENGTLAGVLPLMTIRRGKLRIVKFIGTGQSDACDFICTGRAEIFAGLFDFLFQAKDKWDALALDNIPADSPTHRLLSEACARHGLCVTNYARIASPALVFDPAGENVKQALNKKSIKRHSLYFAKKDGYKVLHLTEEEKIMPCLDDFFEQHMERCRSAGRPSLFHDRFNRSFYKNLVKRLSPEGHLVFTLIKSEGRPAAFHFGFVYNRKFLWYKPSFDARLARHSPGEALLKELFLYAAQNNCAEFDFSIGDEPFKARFSNTRREHVSYKIFKSQPALWADKLLSLVKR